jgi:hypothetical protein
MRGFNSTDRLNDCRSFASIAKKSRFVCAGGGGKKTKSPGTFQLQCHFRHGLFGSYYPNEHACLSYPVFQVKGGMKKLVLASVAIATLLAAAVRLPDLFAVSALGVSFL